MILKEKALCTGRCARAGVPKQGIAEQHRNNDTLNTALVSRLVLRGVRCPLSMSLFDIIYVGKRLHFPHPPRFFLVFLRFQANSFELLCVCSLNRHFVC